MKCQTCGTMLEGVGSALYCPKCFPPAIVYHGPVPMPCPQCEVLRAELARKDEMIDALDEVYMWRDMQVKNFAACLNTGEFTPFIEIMRATKTQHDAALARVNAARARLAQVREGVTP